MLYSQQVFPVFTPEVPSLHLTREKLAFLKNLELDSRGSVVLNRVSKQSLLTPATGSRRPGCAGDVQLHQRLP